MRIAAEQHRLAHPLGKEIVLPLRHDAHDARQLAPRRLWLLPSQRDAAIAGGYTVTGPVP